MATLTDVLACQWRLSFPAKINCRDPSIPTPPFLLPTFPPSPPNRRGRRRGGPAFRFSVAKQTTILPSKSDGGGGTSDFAGVHSVDCVVVGAGISGLVITQALATKHRDVVAGGVLVTEARDRVGGNISTVERDGYLWEEGPNSFQPSDSMLALAVDNGLKDDLVLGDPTAPRFVLWNGKLRPVPSKPTDLPFFDLMSFPGKLRAGLGAFGIRPPPPGHEESVEDFVRRNLGDEVFERLIEPFCSVTKKSVYAGNPASLSMKAAFGKVWDLEQKGGSIIGGAFKAIQERKKNPKPPRDPNLPKPQGETVGSFKKGLAMLPEAISMRLGNKVKLSWKLSGIKKLDGGGYTLTYETPEGLVSVQTKSVIITVPTYVASNLLRPLSEAAADTLSKFYYPPVAVVAISYPKEAIRKECLIDGELKGFGQLHPRSQGVETLGTIYSSSLFPNRAPPGRVLLLNFIGGATNTGILSKTESDLVEAVDHDLRKILIHPNAEKPLVLGVKVWPQAIPQFLVGHLDLVEAAKDALRDGGLHGLFLGGNYVSGVALGRCVEGAYEIADEASNFLAKKRSDKDYECRQQVGAPTVGSHFYSLLLLTFQEELESNSGVLSMIERQCLPVYMAGGNVSVVLFFNLGNKSAVGTCMR
ncbi:Protoporphyrinogen oxidase 1, chloroplastic [Asimina triloba]